MVQDAQARDLALNPTQSFIVQAPAGSGKTELLTQRFLRLLASVDSPEEILAVTFTRKAASQMRQRILQALHYGKQQKTPPEKAHEKTTWLLAQAALKKDTIQNWHLCDNPNRLRILTIDALNSFLVHRMPILAQLGGMPEIIDFPEKIYQQAVELFFQHTQENDPWCNALQQLLLHLDNRVQKVSNLLVLMLKKRDQWLPHIQQIKDPVALEAYLQTCLESIISSHLIAVSEKFTAELASQLMTVITFAAHQLTTTESPIAKCVKLTNLPSCDASALELWEGIVELLLTQQNTWRKSLTVNVGFPSPSSEKDKEIKTLKKLRKEQAQALIETLSQDEGLLALLSEIRILPNSKLSSQQLNILTALIQILPVLVAHLQLIFQETGKVDFIEVNLRALSALGEDLAPSEIALQLDYQLQHVLIDEYQDTSVTQFRLFEKLVAGWQPHDGRTLFLVGDPMQSIYRFRGAEVSLFIHTQQNGLGQVKLKPLTLMVNFRSTSNVVTWINQTFAQIFPRQADCTLGSVPFVPAIAHSEIPSAQAVHFHPLHKEQQVCADYVVNLIREIIKENPHTHIAVLARARKHLAPIIEQLKQAGISFVAHEVEHLAQRFHVVDLLSLLRATQNLWDTTAWYAILRAPWLGLNLADLLILAQHSTHGILWETLLQFQELPALSVHARARLSQFVPIMNYWLKHRQRQSLSQYLRGLWLALGGPACYEQSQLLNDIDKVLEVIEKSTHQGWVDYEEIKAQIEQLYGDLLVNPKESHTSGMVELMTIHKAKGLEFDAVIIPHLQAKTNKQEQELLLWLERSHPQGIDLLLAPRRAQQQEADRLYQYVEYQIQKKNMLEAARLLYVGATRAKNCLHLVAECELDEDQQIKAPAQGCFLAMLWPCLSMHHTQLVDWSGANSCKLKTPAGHLLKRLPSDWQLPLEISRKIAENMDNPSAANLPPYRDQVAICAGIIFHRIVQSWIFRDGAWQNSMTLPRGAHLALKRMGLSEKNLEKAQQLILQALQNMRDDPIGQWLLDGAHQDKKTEWHLTVHSEKGVENYIIDYSFIDKEGVRWIIDYKLLHETHMNAGMLAEELQRYRLQLEKYQKALIALENRTVKAGLYFPLAKAWQELI